MAKVKLARGTQSAYNALASKDSDTLYFCTDSHNIYLGSTLLFEPNAYVDASLSNKVVTFTTHGTNGTTGTDTLDLGVFQTASEVSSAISTAIATAISSVYKPAGSLAVSGIVSGLLIADNQGNVYNVSESFTVGTGTGEISPLLFTDAVTGGTYPAGTNIVVVDVGTAQSPDYRFDILSGLVDLTEYLRRGTLIDTVEIGSVVPPAQHAVLYDAQTLGSSEKAQARSNIGAGTSSFSGSYADLTDKPDVYTKTEVDEIASSLSNFSYVVVQTLPTASELTYGKFYIYDGHRYITDYSGGEYTWIDLGSYNVDLTDYVTEEELDDALEHRPVFQQTTEAAMETMIEAGTWTAGVLYYSVED